MDRELLIKHLAQAEHHAMQGERHLAQQRELIEKLRRDGHDVQNAERLLQAFEESQALHIAEVTRIRRELDRS